MNTYWYRIYLPYIFLIISTFIGKANNYIELNYLLIFCVWFLMGPIGIGVGFHKLFSHCQFDTYKPIKYLLAILGTLVAYCPLSFFIVNHNYHHTHADKTLDPSSPRKGFFESFFLWRMRKTALNYIDLRSYPFRQFLKDPILKFISKRFEIIIAVYILILSLIGIDFLANCFVIPALIEHIRINLISSASHMRLPFSYKNFKTDDDGYNNVILGLITMGFGWHNNHHYDQTLINNRVKWWEIDIEGIIAQYLNIRN